MVNSYKDVRYGKQENMSAVNPDISGLAFFQINTVQKLFKLAGEFGVNAAARKRFFSMATKSLFA